MVAAYKQGITIQQYTILCLLARKPMYDVEIYDAIDMNPGTYRKIALKLLHSKLIKKKHKPAPQDGPGTSKSALSSLTAKGRKVVGVNAWHKGRQISAAFWLSQRPQGAIAATC